MLKTDKLHPKMFRVKLADGSWSDMVNKVRAKDLERKLHAQAVLAAQISKSTEEQGTIKVNKVSKKVSPSVREFP